MASMCSLAQHSTDGWSHSFAGDVIGRDSLETWSRGLRLFYAERAKHDQAQFCDVDYFEFMIRWPRSRASTVTSTSN